MLSKIEELHYFVKSTNAAAMGIWKSKLDGSLLDPEISTVSYKTLRFGRNKQEWDVACYVRND